MRSKGRITNGRETINNSTQKGSNVPTPNRMPAKPATKPPKRKDNKS